MSRRALGLFLTTTLLVACGGGGGTDGGPDVLLGIDAPVDEDAPETIDAPALVDVPEALDADSCAGYEEGYTICPGDTRSCCGGTWRHYLDGPCLRPLDAGVPPGVDGGSPCGSDPTAVGCPCETDGATTCRSLDWQHVCEGGVWVSNAPITCCTSIGF